MDRIYVYCAAGLGALLIGMSLVIESEKGPEPWLTLWTDWAFNYVGLVVAAYSIVKIANGAASRLKHGRIAPDK